MTKSSRIKKLKVGALAPMKLIIFLPTTVWLGVKLVEISVAQGAQKVCVKYREIVPPPTFLKTAINKSSQTFNVANIQYSKIFQSQH